jgi:hypothetical protein
VSQRPARERRAFRLGVANGALYQGGEGFIDSGTVVPVFLSQMTTSNTLIGVASTLPDAGWLLPQVLVTPWVASHRRQLWLYRIAVTIRAAGLALVALLTPFLLERHPLAMLVVFFLGYGAYCLGGGLGSVPFIELVGKVVPRERLGRFWSSRLLYGGSLAALAGLGVREVMRWPDPGLRFGALFAIATVIIAIAWALLLRIEEPDGVPDPRPLSAVGMLREGYQLLQQPGTFRDLFLSRLMLTAWTAASPFIVLFAVDQLRGGAEAVGTFLFARVAGFVLSNLFWARLSARRGDATVMRCAVGLVAGTALAAAAVAWLSPWGLGWLPAGTAVLAFEVLAFAGGCAQAGILVAFGALLLAYAPEGGRQRWVSEMMTFLGITMVLPMLAGVVVDLVNAPTLFAFCGMVALLGSGAAARLPERRGPHTAAVAGSPDPLHSGGGR